MQAGGTVQPSLLISYHWGLGSTRTFCGILRRVWTLEVVGGEARGTRRELRRGGDECAASLRLYSQNHANLQPSMQPSRPAVAVAGRVRTTAPALGRSQIDLMITFAPPALLALEPPDVLTC